MEKSTHRLTLSYEGKDGLVTMSETGPAWKLMVAFKMWEEMATTRNPNFSVSLMALPSKSKRAKSTI